MNLHSVRYELVQFFQIFEDRTKYILSGINGSFIWIKCHIPVMHKFCCGTKTAGKTQAATWGSSSKDWAFFRRTQSWKSCLTFSKLMKYSLDFCRNSWSGFGSAAKSTWFSSWIGWIGINLIVKFPLPLDLQYNTGSFKKLDLSYVTQYMKVSHFRYS